MCKYCEKLKGECVEFLLDDIDMMAYIMPPTPILEILSPDKPATLHIENSDISFNISIKYCPICGKEIK